MSDAFKVEKFNGIDITTDSAGRFNLSELFNRYQPKNKNTKRYLQSGKFSQLFGIASRKLASEVSTEPVETPKLAIQDCLASIYDVKTGPNRFRGIYIPREYLNVILMVLDSNYRAIVNATMETLNDVNQGEAPNPNDITITNTATGRSQAVNMRFDPDSWQMEEVEVMPADILTCDIDKWNYTHGNKMW
jgi:hypothetical protein